MQIVYQTNSFKTWSMREKKMGPLIFIYSLNIIKYLGSPETVLDWEASGIIMAMFEKMVPLCATLWIEKHSQFNRIHMFARSNSSKILLIQKYLITGHSNVMRECNDRSFWQTLEIT